MGFLPKPQKKEFNVLLILLNKSQEDEWGGAHYLLFHSKRTKYLLAFSYVIYKLRN